MIHDYDKIKPLHIRRIAMIIMKELTMLAIIPGLLIIIYVYRKDKVEKEPAGLIFRTMIYGAISALLAGVLEGIAEGFLPSYEQGTLQYALQTAFLLAAFWEENVKYWAMRKCTWRYPGFNYRFDGVVYGVSSAVGFAILENLTYVYRYGFQTAVVRAFTAVPLHAFCGVAMGVFYAYEKKAALRGEGSGKFKFLALLVPMIIHGVYDTFAFLGTTESEFALLAFVVIMYIVAIKAIKKLSAEDYKEGF